MTIEVDFKTSMADLALVGAELFERLRELCGEVDATRGWDEQPQHVRLGICILFAKVRNRTAVPVGWRPPFEGSAHIGVLDDEDIEGITGRKP